MKVIPDKATTIVAAVALAVGTLSAAGGVLVNRAANHKVCAVETHDNAAIRGLIDDFILQNPKITVREKAQADAIGLSRFPLKPC